MINTSQSYCNLSLSDDQFDALYDTLQEEVYQIKESIGNLDLTLKWLWNIPYIQTKWRDLGRVKYND